MKKQVLKVLTDAERVFNKITSAKFKLVTLKINRSEAELVAAPAPQVLSQIALNFLSGDKIESLS